VERIGRESKNQNAKGKTTTQKGWSLRVETGIKKKSLEKMGNLVTPWTWQQIILVDFETRARTRTVICQMIW
jgi:hypothetical protein